MTSSVFASWEAVESYRLRTIVPLVSYIRFLSDFGIMPPLLPVVKMLKKIGVTEKIWEKAGVNILRILWQLPSFLRLLLIFSEKDQRAKVADW